MEYPLKTPDATFVKTILEKNRLGIDGLAIIPVVELGGPLEETLQRIDRGFIPSSYRWTQKKQSTLTVSRITVAGLKASL
jgi:hypothetical protein